MLVADKNDLQQNQQRTPEPLFLQGSSSSDIGHQSAPGPRDDEDFVLDTSLFDIQPSASQGLTASFASRTGFSTPSPPASQMSRSVHQANKNITSVDTMSSIPAGDQSQIDMPEADDDILAEFEAWTRSDSVVIMDKQY